MSIVLYDKTNIDSLVIGNNKDEIYAKNYLVPMIKEGVNKYIKNIETDLRILKIDNLILPININNKEYKNSYTSSLYAHYVSYAIKELKELKSPFLEYILKIILKTLGFIYKIGKIDKVVYVNNWFLSTNLYPKITEEQFFKITDFLKEKFPNHSIVFRSLNEKLLGDYINILSKLDYRMFVSRQVYIFDKDKRSKLKKKIKYQLNKDIKLLNETDYTIISGFPKERVEEIKNLYNQLYLNKYSKFNPQFSNDFFNLVMEKDLINFKIFSKNKKYDAVLGYFERSNVIMAPIFGYNLNLNKDAGFYRMLSAKIILEAERIGCTLNGSSGASNFKIQRGSEASLEYSAILYSHLPFYRKFSYNILLQVLNKIAIPLIKKKKL